MSAARIRPLACTLCPWTSLQQLRWPLRLIKLPLRGKLNGATKPSSIRLDQPIWRTRPHGIRLGCTVQAPYTPASKTKDRSKDDVLWWFRPTLPFEHSRPGRKHQRGILIASFLQLA